jgi:RNA-directed DNA polymerase
LGVPTVADRVAQTVAAMTLEPRMESIFHADSYGYRPNRSALDAVATCRKRCWTKAWVIDLDVAAFFDSVPWDLMVKAVEANITTEQRWVLLYVKRWLQAPLQLPDGPVRARDRGTPQGSSISPVLANLFLHYAFDSWLACEFPTVEFERYADDAIVHCVSERQARQVLAAISERMEQVGLRLHPDKTTIVYCKDKQRPGAHEHTSFTFLGYTFAPRAAMGKDGMLFTAFLPAVSQEALTEMGREVRRWRLHMWTARDLDELATQINPVVAGWMNYYGRFYRSRLSPLLQRINTYLMRWPAGSTNGCGPTSGSRRGGTGSSIETPNCSRTGAGSARSQDCDEKSGVTGDCHAPFRRSPGLQCPGRPDKQRGLFRYRHPPCPRGMSGGALRVRPYPGCGG